MKRKIVIPRIFVAAFAVLGVLLFSANLVSAQCGNYFKTNYSTISKVSRNFVNPVPVDDWNGDGKSDFWIFRTSGTGSGLEVVIYPTKPTGYWDWDNPIIYATTILSNNISYKAIDMDADGRKDLVAYFGGFNGGFQVHRNTGNGSLTPLPAVNENVPTSYLDPAVLVDINGDNLLDWLYSATPSDTSELRYRLQNADGSFSSSSTILRSSPANGFNGSSRMTGDFNGDGKIDILYVTTINNAVKYVMIKNLGGGNFEVGTPVAEPNLHENPVVRDFNNDGKADILSVMSGGIIIFFGQSNGTFNRTQILGMSGPVFSAELNGDNNLDIIQVNSNSYATYINNGASGFSQTFYQKSLVNYQLGSNQWVFEDFSGDGKADFYSPRPSNDNYTYNIFSETLLTVRENICQPFGETKQADLDGNASADVVMWNPSSGNWSSKNARWSTAADPNTRVFNWGLGSHGDVPAPGDFDGDGKTDYSVYRNSTGVWYIFKSSDSAWLTFPFGLTGDIAVPNDYDGGGKTDIAVFRPADGNWYIWFSETQQFQALHFGASGDKPVPADYDGDGKTDVAVFRPSEGNWYYLKSSDGNFAITHWGIETDKPVPADYDGDGRADLTVYRGGTWWILRSSNNSSVAIGWGTASDIPVPVYRNSVSADMTFYRPSNNSWHSFDFRNFSGFALGGNQDVPVYFGLPNN